MAPSFSEVASICADSSNGGVIFDKVESNLFYVDFCFTKIEKYFLIFIVNYIKIKKLKKIF